MVGFGVKAHSPGSMADAKSGWMSFGPTGAALTLMSTWPHSS